MNLYEADFTEWGYRELDQAKDLLELYLDSGLNLGGFKLAFNANSGYVFIYDEEDGHVYMDNDGKLEEFFTCAECGNEGFAEEFDTEADCRECRRIAGNSEEDE